MRRKEGAARGLSQPSRPRFWWPPEGNPSSRLPQRSSTPRRASELSDRLSRHPANAMNPSNPLSLVLADCADHIGVERAVWELATRLPRDRFSTRVWLSSDPDK